MKHRKSRWVIAFRDTSWDGLVVDQEWFEPKLEHYEASGTPVPNPLTKEFVVEYGLELMYSNGMIWVYEERLTDNGEWLNDEEWEEGLHGEWSVGPKTTILVLKEADTSCDVQEPLNHKVGGR